MKEPEARRRPLLIGLAGGAAALGVAATAARISSALQDPPTDSALPALTLSSESVGMASLSVALDKRLLTTRTGVAMRTAGLTTSVHSMVGVTWTGPASPRLRIRSRADGRWSGWRTLPRMHDLPDHDSDEGSVALNSTQLAWTGDCDGIQIEVDGERPADLTLVLLRPEPLATDQVRTPMTRAATPSPGTVPQPTLLTRADWGADESWRNGQPRYNKTIEQAHVHHTASGNDYGEDDVPAILRGFYRYHTKTLGWSDIAYNFLVDRFGRIWVGRAGGPALPVRGAHTLGFNATSVGIAVIGNFDTATPIAKVLQSIAAVAAWKLHPYGRDPQGSIRVDSEGSDKFRAGRVVTLPVIDGHRDTNDTACPGNHVYERLSGIRQRTQKIIQRAENPPAVQIVTPSTLAGTPLIGQTLTITPGTFDPANVSTSCTWLRDGAVIPGASGLSYRLGGDDLGALVTARLETTRAGYDAAVEELAATGAVQAATAVTVISRPRVRKARVRVRVDLVGADQTATGDVVVTLRRQQQRVTLTDGVAVARFTGLRPGRATATVSYLGTTSLQPSDGSAEVVIQPRPKRSS